MSRLLTDLLLAGLVAAVIMGAWWIIPVMLDSLFDPWHDQFEDVDELAERDR